MRCCIHTLQQSLGSEPSPVVCGADKDKDPPEAVPPTSAQIQMVAVADLLVSLTASVSAGLTYDEHPVGRGPV